MFSQVTFALLRKERKERKERKKGHGRIIYQGRMKWGVQGKGDVEKECDYPIVGVYVYIFLYNCVYVCVYESTGPHLILAT